MELKWGQSRIRRKVDMGCAIACEEEGFEGLEVDDSTLPIQ